MKRMTKLGILLAMVVLSAPAYGLDILVYQLQEKDMALFELIAGQWYVSKGSQKGFLVLEVDFSGATPVYNDATVVMYGTDDTGTKYQQTSNIPTLSLVVADADDGNTYWINRLTVASPNLMELMLEGKAKAADIGTGTNQVVPKGLNGTNLRDDTSGGGGVTREIARSQYKAKFDKKRTMEYNQTPLTFAQSVTDVENDLTAQGYN